VLARLWRRTEDPDAVPQPMSLTVAPHCGSELTPSTVAATVAQNGALGASASADFIPSRYRRH
jgi:hypothetical protein